LQGQDVRFNDELHVKNKMSFSHELDDTREINPVENYLQLNERQW
jgi:hypothetical protein